MLLFVRAASLGHKAARDAVVSLLACGALACQSSRDAAGKVEAAEVVRAIETLRGAPHDQKTEPLAALGEVSCTEDEVCQLKEQCFQAYGLLVSGLRQVATIKEIDRADPKALTVEPLIQSEKTLKSARDLMLKCSEAEARLKVRLRL